MRWNLGKLSKGVEVDYHQTILNEILKVIKNILMATPEGGVGKVKLRFGVFFSLTAGSS